MNENSSPIRIKKAKNTIIQKIMPDGSPRTKTCEYFIMTIGDEIFAIKTQTAKALIDSGHAILIGDETLKATRILAEYKTKSEKLKDKNINKALLEVSIPDES